MTKMTRNKHLAKRALLALLCVSALLEIWGCSDDKSNPSGPSDGATNQWTLGGSVTGIARRFWVDGGTLYLLTSNGVFRSNDTARTWTQLVTRAQVNLAGGFEGGVVAQGSIIYAGSSDYAFFSSDGGISWRKIRSGLGATNYVCESLYRSGNRVFYGSNVGGAFRATFGDTTWTTAFTTGGLHSVQAFFNHNDTLYAGHEIGMHRSFDDGATWNLAPTTGLPTTDSRKVFAFTKRGSSLYIATNQGVYVSRNGGASYSAVNGLPTGELDDDVRALATAGNSVLVGMRYRGVWRSTDGVNFTDWSQGIPQQNDNVADLAVMGNVVIMASSDPSPTIWIRRIP